MALTTEQMGFAQARAESGGLVLSYARYSKFGDDAFDVAKSYCAQAGKMRGENLKRSMKIEGNDANAVAACLTHSYLELLAWPRPQRWKGTR